MTKHIFVEGKTYKVLVNGCWEWLGAKDRAGYGTRRIGKRNKSKNWFAHRLSYKHYNGDFDESLCVCHSCDNPICINPEHLFLGTHADNMRDMTNKGRNKGPRISMRGEKHPRAVYSQKIIKRVKNLISEGLPNHVIAKNTEVHVSTVNQIKRGVNRCYD